MTLSAAVLLNWNEAHKQFHQARQKDQDEVQPLTVRVQKLEQEFQQARLDLLKATAERDKSIEHGQAHREMVTLWCEAHKEPLPPVPAEYADPTQLADVNVTRPEPTPNGAPS
jgi:hypothetical protein